MTEERLWQYLPNDWHEKVGDDLFARTRSSWRTATLRCVTSGPLPWTAKRNSPKHTHSICY